MQIPAIYNITVDNNVTWGDADQLYAVPFYESPDLEYGEHQLDVTVDRQWSSDWKRYIFDFLTIRVKNDTTDSNRFIVDESDPIVRYDGNWEQDVSAKYGYRHTTHKASSSGCVSILPFYGNSIEVYGAFRSSSNDLASIMSFQIDDGPKYNYDSLNTQGTIKPNVRLFLRAGISDGQHTLRIESLTTTEVWLDYFMYKTSPTSANTTNQSSSSTPQSQKSQTAATAGGVVGGVAGLALIIVLLLLYRRHRRKPVDKESKYDIHGGSMGHETTPKPPYVIEPFTSPDTRSTPLISSETRQQKRREIHSISSASSPYESSNPSSYDHPPPPQVRLAGPLPQKYRNRQGESAPVASHDPSSYSAITGTDTRISRSPPPNYSNL
ncbi:hypothetical protein CPB86DRAFT_818380 [Serendipita vermifera]|nr:hypothetical protein CPB86DRAFT_818380 [Serendipita vermifera]